MADDEFPGTNADLAEGYRRRAERGARIAAELEGSSKEANERLGDTPEW